MEKDEIIEKLKSLAAELRNEIYYIDDEYVEKLKELLKLINTNL